MALCIFNKKYGGLNLIACMILNLVYGIYMAEAQALEKRSLNRQDLFNECMVAASIYWKLLYSDIVIE